jgi:hypothetical protein
MTGNEERQDLIAKLTVAHPLPGLLVTRIHQHGQQVARMLVDAFAVPDEVIHQVVKGFSRGWGCSPEWGLARSSES